MPWMGGMKVSGKNGRCREWVGRRGKGNGWQGKGMESEGGREGRTF